MVRRISSRDLRGLSPVQRYESRDIKDLSPRVISQQDADRVLKTRELDLFATSERRKKRESTFGIIQWVIGSGVLLWLIVGSGVLIGALTIMSSTPWPFWVLLIFILISLWRRR